MAEAATMHELNSCSGGGISFKNIAAAVGACGLAANPQQITLNPLTMPT